MIVHFLLTCYGAFFLVLIFDGYLEKGCFWMKISQTITHQMTVNIFFPQYFSRKESVKKCIFIKENIYSEINIKLIHIKYRCVPRSWIICCCILTIQGKCSYLLIDSGDPWAFLRTPWRSEPSLYKHLARGAEGENNIRECVCVCAFLSVCCSTCFIKRVMSALIQGDSPHLANGTTEVKSLYLPSFFHKHIPPPVASPSAAPQPHLA